MTRLLNTRILASLAMIVFVGTVVASSTGAFFSDTETSTGNTFTAGAIDLTVDNVQHYNGMVCAETSAESDDYIWVPAAQAPLDVAMHPVVNPAFDCAAIAAFNLANPAQYPQAGVVCDGSWRLTDLDDESFTSRFFNFLDIKPGDMGENTISLHVDNNDAWMCAALGNVGGSDNGINEPEGQSPLEDSPASELPENMQFFAWADDGDNTYEVGESALTPSPVDGDDVTGGVFPIADSITNGGAPIVGDTTTYVAVAWCAGTMAQPVAGSPIVCDGSTMGNEAQTDSMTADVQFYVVQSRNNAQFQCVRDFQPTFPDAPQQLAVGADFEEYAAPVCEVTVAGSESIQTAVNAATDGDVVCVDPTYNGTGDTGAIRIENAGVTLAATVRGVDLFDPIVLSASNVTVTGFDGVIGQAESPAEQAAFYLDNDADTAEISFNRVTGGTGAAILTETGAALAGGLIANNVLDGATQGIYLNPHTGTIIVEYNDIDNNAAGIGGLNGATVRYNEFEHTTPGSEAIGVDPTHDANPATVNFNNFLDGTMLNTYVAIAGDVNAQNNFWGPNGGAAQTGGTDEVNFMPVTVAQYPHN